MRGRRCCHLRRHVSRAGAQMPPPPRHGARFRLRGSSPSGQVQPHRVLPDDARAGDRPDFRYGPSDSVPSLAAVYNHRHCLRHRLTNYLGTSFAGPPWPPQATRIARAALYPKTLFVGQAFAASPAAKGRLRRPWLKEKLRPVGAKVSVWVVISRSTPPSVELIRCSAGDACSTS